MKCKVVDSKTSNTAEGKISKISDATNFSRSIYRFQPATVQSPEAESHYKEEKSCKGRAMREINIFSTQLRSQTKFYWLDQTSASETRQNSSLKISTKLFNISIKLQLQLYVQTSEPASLSTSTKNWF